MAEARRRVCSAAVPALQSSQGPAQTCSYALIFDWCGFQLGHYCVFLLDPTVTVLFGEKWHHNVPGWNVTCLNSIYTCKNYAYTERGCILSAGERMNELL